MAFTGEPIYLENLLVVDALEGAGDVVKQKLQKQHSLSGNKFVLSRTKCRTLDGHIEEVTRHRTI